MGSRSTSYSSDRSCDLGSRCLATQRSATQPDKPAAPTTACKGPRAVRAAPPAHTKRKHPSHSPMAASIRSSIKDSSKGRMSASALGERGCARLDARLTLEAAPAGSPSRPKLRPPAAAVPAAAPGGGVSGSTVPAADTALRAPPVPSALAADVGVPEGGRWPLIQESRGSLFTKSELRTRGGKAGGWQATGLV